ncbi:hypothetical protein [Streptomyces sp. NPDC058664]|uniref:hypothetical protein n=1 Tax=unclassified Streptomyces TaxID=2593676 RepID=UPI00365CB0DE
MKNVLLTVMIPEHLGIAVVLGVPFLSAAMIVCDAVFLPTAFLMALGARCARLRLPSRAAAPWEPGRPRPRADPAPAPRTTAPPAFPAGGPLRTWTTSRASSRRSSRPLAP